MKFSLQNVSYWIGKVLVLGAIIYFGVIGITNPEMFSGMIPGWLSIIPATTLVILHGIIMIIAALFTLFEIGGRWAYYVLILTIAAVVINVSGMTLVRDIAIFGSTFLLLSATYSRQKSA